MKFFAKIAAPLFPLHFHHVALLLIIHGGNGKSMDNLRPLQDLAYTVVFLFLGLQSWWDSQAYNNSTTATGEGISLDDVPLERSWLLHTLYYQHAH
ncbi:hypothetical protein QTG54_008388 [Skeletonema marinoi]|uniref:Uncharacterized protein n=1 Tax=Skeletonema marinoi TaxID=267567 RepID=A0AAD8Y9B3_9STRA|nr:hypothetical protein QTG54_008388 [Skeletonema marinoi]